MFKSKFSRSDKAVKQQPVFKQHYFNNCHKTYSCIHCRAHLANHDELISKLFQGNHGRAYLFNKVVNIGCKQAVQRELLTGLHAVADIYCDNCDTTLGWKYEQAFVPSQKYKEGKYIIELVHMLKENDWDLTSYNARELLFENSSASAAKRANQSRGLESRGRENFLVGINELNNFKVEDKNNGVLRTMSLEYELGRVGINSIGTRRDSHQESVVDIVSQPKQNPPTATFDVSLGCSRENGGSQAEVRSLKSVEVNNQIEMIGSSINGSQLTRAESHLGEAGGSLVSPRDSLSPANSQSHSSLSANSMANDQASDDEAGDALAQLSNGRYDVFKIIEVESPSEQATNRNKSGDILKGPKGFNFLLSNIEADKSSLS